MQPLKVLSFYMTVIGDKKYAFKEFCTSLRCSDGVFKTVDLTTFSTIYKSSKLVITGEGQNLYFRQILMASILQVAPRR